MRLQTLECFRDSLPLTINMHLCTFINMNSNEVIWTKSLLSVQMKRLKITQIDLSIATGASQSQVSRILSGQTSMRSKLAQEICIYVSSKMMKKSVDRVAHNKELMDALASVWDGTPSHAHALAAVIRSLTHLTSMGR